MKPQLVALAALVPIFGACRGAALPTSQGTFYERTIQRAGDGTVLKGELVAASELQQLPCRGWAHFRPDGSLRSVELARDAELGGRALPAGTRVFLDEQGRLESCWLSRTTSFDGVPCRGGFGKTSTAFHPDGGLRACFPPDDIEIQGIPCEATPFVPIYFHANRRLASCRLSRAVVLEGIEIPSGSTIRLDAQGRLLAERP
jgi:hypothetical protein